MFYKFINFILRAVTVYPSDRHTLVASAARRFSPQGRNGESDEWGRNWIEFAEKSVLVLKCRRQWAKNPPPLSWMNVSENAELYE